LKKVLIFTYSDKVGGSETNAYKIIKLSKEAIFDWLVLNSSNTYLTREIKNCDNLENFISLDLTKDNFIKKLRCLYNLLKILKKNNYSTIYAVGFLPSLLTSILKPFFDFKLISTRRERLHWTRFHHKPFIKLIYYMSDYIETNSKSILIELQKSKITNSKVYFLPNIILKKNVKQHQIFNEKNKYIGNVANVREAKNIDLFLSLALKMLNKNKDLIFLLIGRDTSDDKVKNFINKNNLINKLIILEDINFDEIYSIYNGLDIFLFTSKFEGSPNVLTEAMSVSLPIVSSRIFATEEIIKNGVNGFLCDLNNENDFIEKLNLLLTDKKRYEFIKNNTKEYYEKSNSLNLSIEIIREKILRI